MSILFDPIRIKNMKLPNRFVRSATYDGCGDRTGTVSDRQVKIFEELAQGGVGLIITGLTYVHSSGQSAPFQNSVAGDESIPSLSRLTRAVHDLGANIALQLFHAGREAARFLKSRNEQAIAPSVISNDPFFDEKYREITDDEIQNVILAFGNAARRAREAKFDAVQLHGAHGKLLSQFLSPYTNRRSDSWGGSLKQRLHFHHEIYRSIRRKVGEGYPLLIKLGVEDGFPGGLKFEEGKIVAKLLSEWGFDGIEISVGLRGERYEGTEFRTRISSKKREAYYRNWCKEIKNHVKVPLMMVGGLRSYELIEEIVQKGDADLVSLSRPLIREPNIINEWKRGDHHRANCISCNKCVEGCIEGKELQCFVSTARKSTKRKEVPDEAERN